MRKKLATFIVVTLMGATLTGCGKNYDIQISEMKNDIAILEQRLEELETNSSTTTVVKESPAETEAEKEEQSNSFEETAKVKPESFEDIPVISLENEKIQVSVLYNGESTPITARTEAERDKAINDPLYLNVPKNGRLRDISFLISGVSVKDMYIVDREFKVLEDIKYDSVSNTYSAYYYMPGGGQYTVLIETVNGSHYYVSVVY